VFGAIVDLGDGVRAEVLEATPRQVRWLRLRYDRPSEVTEDG